jgi:hypothetical protein
VSELMHYLLTCENQSQADQPNSLAEGPSYVNLNHGKSKSDRTHIALTSWHYLFDI